MNIHILMYSNSKSRYFCMPGRWLTTGQCGHILAFSARRPRSLHHTWPHRWSCRCMAHQGGCSWCCLRRCGFGLKLDTPGLRWRGINVSYHWINWLIRQSPKYLHTKEQDCSNHHWLGKSTGIRLSNESQVYSGNYRKSWNDLVHEDGNTLGNPVLVPAEACMQLLKKNNISFEIWLQLVHIYIYIIAHLLRSVGPGNQDGTGRCSSLLSPRSLHKRCTNPPNKRLQTNRD